MVLEPAMKHFWLIRHAKSDWNLPDQADVERDLNTRGRRDGELMQAAFERLSANSGHQPDWLVTSRATRAQATAEYVLAGSGLARDHMIVDPGLYNATPEALLAALREAPIEAQCVALVAHNPGLTWLVNALGGAAGDAPEATSKAGQTCKPQRYCSSSPQRSSRPNQETPRPAALTPETLGA